MKYWFDVTNTPQVHFLLAIKKGLEDGRSSFQFTSRDFSETVQLLRNNLNGYNINIIGRHYGNNQITKALGLMNRFWNIKRIPLDYDVSISMGSESAVWKTFLERKISIAFGDNDTAKQWTYGKFVNYAFFPNAIPSDILYRQGLKGKMYQYDGFKEDIYLSYFKPDKTFKSSLPFEEYVIVRPENIQANYMKSSPKSITRSLLKCLSENGYRILYLPRYRFDKEYASGIENIFIPDKPINGLDACYYANAVLTGAGTLAREAACLGVPAISFYAGKNLLAVDRKMINDGWLYHSRDPKDIIIKLRSMKRKNVSLERSISVRKEVITKLKEIISRLIK